MIFIHYKFDSGVKKLPDVEQIIENVSERSFEILGKNGTRKLGGKY